MVHNYTVLGLGTFGYQMAISLQKGGGQVLAIDLNEAVIQKISPYVTKAVVADIANQDALEQLGVYESDAVVVGVPDYFDIAVLVTHFLSRAKVPQIFVQVESRAQASAIEAVGATQAIFPERDIAQRIAGQLLSPGLADHIPLGEDVSIVEMPCPESWAGKTLLELNVRSRFNVYIIGLKIHTNNEKQPVVFEILPAPDRPLDSTDDLLVLGKTKKLVELKRKLGLLPK